MKPTRHPSMLRSALWLALASAAVGEACAISGGITTVAGHGLQIAVDTTWVEGAGYQPIRVAINPVAKLGADRVLTLEFRAETYGRGELIIEREVVVPQNTARVTLDVPLLDAHFVHSIELRVFEGGRERPQLMMQLTVSGTQWWNDGLPNVLFVADTMPDHAPLAELFPSGQSTWQPWSPNPNSAPPTMLASAFHLPLDALPERWIDYSSLDVVVIAWDRLRGLAARRPAAWSALRRWVRGGGNLCVIGVEAAARSELTAMLATAGDDWREPEESDRDSRILDASFARNEGDATVVHADGSVEVLDESSQGAPSAPSTPAPGAPPFVWRECGLGSVTALTDPQALPGSRTDWAWVLNTLGPDRWLFYRRHGVSALSANQDFWNFLVPGVGLAPVTAFRVVITAFVLLIGPVNYWLLQRRGQLQWLLITVPSAALVVTLGMFFYAMVSDGLTVRCRARSYTWLDQRTAAEAVTFGRLSYYAGLAPRGGLQFSDQTAVLPLHAEPTSEDGARRRRLIWAGDRQWLQSGWLISRRTTQFATIRAEGSTRGLQFRRRSDGGLQVVNELGSPLLGLLVCDAEGRLYQALRPEAGEFLLRPVSPDDALDEYIGLLNRYLPQLPPEIDPTGTMPYRRSRRYYYGQSQVPAPDFDTSMLERRWTRLRNEVANGKLAPRTYLAILADAGELELGTDEARPEASAHIVEGVW